jgi:hypothetical protein
MLLAAAIDCTLDEEVDEVELCFKMDTAILIVRISLLFKRLKHIIIKVLDKF